MRHSEPQIKAVNTSSTTRRPALPPSITRQTSSCLPMMLEEKIQIASSQTHDPSNLPTVYKNNEPNKYHLTPADIEEIRKLRLSDPMTWSRYKLAKRFDCSALFIAMVCEASPEKKEIQKQVLEAVQSRWGPKRRMAREDRQLRREAWGRDE
ncbi:mitochondrial 54S ribosomal protein YmL20 [Penicillium chermesinum]|uniref:Mitochondrial 54S ribosomal protein YmL20 n=1 Tax=Penicillium chermesinum TaxID=63820 RepID=A0A9W9NGY9_9EURO|nr:mitochondrial 54S ribosomal protein YmL20 [Penicillium chermesinum]KAJ5219794.1 mitochondrial 54S ribosomal protein YmL20 [Penicillium chermesinum]